MSTKAQFESKIGNANIFLLIENPAKSTNLGPILRCASAFGISKVVAVGFSQCSVAGSHGASKHVEIIAFPTVNQAAQYLRETCHAQLIVGSLGSCPGGFDHGGYTLETTDDKRLIRPVVNIGRTSAYTEMPADCIQLKSAISRPVYAHSFDGATCLAISRERTGLSITLAQECDSFVHVPHEALTPVSTEASSSSVTSGFLLDTPSTMSIVLYHATSSLGFTERTFDGHKFEVASRRKCGPNKADEARRHERVQQRAQRSEEADIGDVTLLFDNDDY